MKRGLRRCLADLVCRAILAMLPGPLKAWGWAIRRETADITDDTGALLFALDGFCGLLPHAIAARLPGRAGASVEDPADAAGGNVAGSILNRPRVVGTACAIGAVMLGLVHLATAGAPVRFLAVNALALALGLALLAALDRVLVAGPRRTAGTILAMAGLLLATATFGDTVDGAARWVSLGGLTIQPSLILLPAMLVAFARTRSVVATLAMVAAAAAMALQPDRAMAGMLAAALAVLAILRPDRHSLSALAAGMVSFGATLLQADGLPAVPYVDQVFRTSFEVHVAIGAAVLGGSALLVVPAVVGWRYDPAHRPAHLVFGAAWLAGIAAAALGNYPTPLVGYGGSAILGYLLSLSALPRQHLAAGTADRQTRRAADPGSTDRHLRVPLPASV